MRKVELTRGLVALVDDEDFERVNQLKWNAVIKRNTIYAIRRYRILGVQKSIRMHRFILNCSEELQIDHKNGNGLDNQRSNLRTCNNQQNHFNTAPQKNTSSKYKGVCWDKRKSKYMSKIMVDGKCIFLGYHDNEIESALCYDNAAQKYFGEFARLNFNEKNHGTKITRVV